MKIIEVKDYQALSKKAAQYIIEKVREAPYINLGLATGGTPIGMYQLLVEDYRNSHTSYKNVTTFNLDEYVGLSGQHPNSYRYFMNDKLFNHIGIKKGNTYVPKGDAVDILAECQQYEQLIEVKGGIDLQILGIGSNGHIGFNEPGTSFASNTHIVELTESTRAANARFFSTLNLNEVPTKAITMGIASIMKSKEILLLISGEAKSDALYRLLHDGVSEAFPASVLKNHPHVTIIADEAALRKKVTLTSCC